MHKLVSFTTLFSVFLMIGCAPRHLKHNVSPTKRQPVLQQSHTRFQQGERNISHPKIRQFLDNIKYYLGTPYRFGGGSRLGMDCSGFVSTIFRESFNIELPHNAHKIYQKCQKLAHEELTLGDLVFFRTSNKRKINHVGIYLAENYFVHSSVRYGVVISELTDNYYRLRFAGASRVIDLKNSSFGDK